MYGHKELSSEHIQFPVKLTGQLNYLQTAVMADNL